jgi:hypothetical protein
VNIKYDIALIYNMVGPAGAPNGYELYTGGENNIGLRENSCRRAMFHPYECCILKGPSGRIRSAREWYHWIGLG